MKTLWIYSRKGSELKITWKVSTLGPLHRSILLKYANENEPILGKNRYDLKLLGLKPRLNSVPTVFAKIGKVIKGWLLDLDCLMHEVLEFTKK